MRKKNKMRTLETIKDEINEKIDTLKNIFSKFTFSVSLQENEIKYVYTLKKIFYMCHILYDHEEKILFISYNK